MERKDQSFEKIITSRLVIVLFTLVAAVLAFYLGQGSFQATVNLSLVNPEPINRDGKYFSTK
jgi:hypothetical protein